MNKELLLFLLQSQQERFQSKIEPHYLDVLLLLFRLLMKTMIVYHANCIDGITSATVVNKFLLEKEGTPQEDIHTFPMSYDDDIVELYQKLTAFEIENLYIVDFSFNVQTLLELNNYVALISLYDHHASAFRNLMGSDYPLHETSHEQFYLRDEHNDPTDIFITLNNNESGASLCWKKLMNAPDTFDDVSERDLPNLIKYVRDYDLWRFKHPETKALNKVFKALSKDVLTFTALLTFLDEPLAVSEYHKQGLALLEYEESIEDSIISQSTTPITINGISGLVCNAPYAFASNIGYKLALKSKTFGAIWTQQSEGRVVFSLRSNGDECDVSKLAEVMGGGGHKNASGFSFLSPNYDEEQGITLWSKGEEETHA